MKFMLAESAKFDFHFLKYFSLMMQINANRKTLPNNKSAKTKGTTGVSISSEVGRRPY